MIELKKAFDLKKTREEEEFKLEIIDRCNKEKEQLKQTTIQNFNSQTTVLSSQWKIKCQNDLTVQMEELNTQCKDEKQLIRKELEKKHTDKETEQRLKIEELVKDLGLEKEKLLNTIDALNKSNKKGDKFQIRIDELLIKLEETEKKHQRAMDEMYKTQDKD